MFENILFFLFGFRACAFPLGFLPCRIPVGFQVVQSVAVYALRPYPVGECEPAYLRFAQSEQAHDVSTNTSVPKGCCPTVPLSPPSPVHLRFRKALGGVGFDAGYRVAHTEVVETPVGVIELLAYLRHRIKVACDTLLVCKRITDCL